MFFANKIYETQNKVFHLNLDFGIILFKQEDKEYPYFKPYKKIDSPIYISSRKDLTTFEEKKHPRNRHLL